MLIIIFHFVSFQVSQLWTTFVTKSIGEVFFKLKLALIHNFEKALEYHANEKRFKKIREFKEIVRNVSNMVKSAGRWYILAMRRLHRYVSNLIVSSYGELYNIYM